LAKKRFKNKTSLSPKMPFMKGRPFLTGELRGVQKKVKSEKKTNGDETKTFEEGREKNREDKKMMQPRLFARKDNGQARKGVS